MGRMIAKCTECGDEIYPRCCCCLGLHDYQALEDTLNYMAGALITYNDDPINEGPSLQDAINTAKEYWSTSKRVNIDLEGGK